ncbi:hypothetical protein Bca4012_033927 [Brassica carinata]|uniref:TF-B3 domain-containing protein n=2 Tax=Brassica TaxID=3705 RepID=A0A0D3C487_BRAOL|nr:hypothetical protein F2Q69_00017339 [Brassica cretica]
MDMNSWFDRVKEDRKNLSFSKTFACADLSSECMRTFPFDLMKSLPKEDLANKMVIIAKCGSSWEVDISKNPRFYYMEKSGWNQFVRDNALGKNEFVTFTHKGSMCFDVNIYGKDEKEITIPNLFKKHIPNEQTMFTIHSKGSGCGSWEVWCLVREAQATFSRGWSKFAREYPIEIGDKCTLQLIKPNECVLTISNKAKEEEITVID